MANIRRNILNPLAKLAILAKSDANICKSMIYSILTLPNSRGLCQLCQMAANFANRIRPRYHWTLPTLPTLSALK